MDRNNEYSDEDNAKYVVLGCNNIIISDNAIVIIDDERVINVHNQDIDDIGIDSIIHEISCHQGDFKDLLSDLINFDKNKSFNLKFLNKSIHQINQNYWLRNAIGNYLLSKFTHIK